MQTLFARRCFARAPRLLKEGCVLLVFVSDPVHESFAVLAGSEFALMGEVWVVIDSIHFADGLDIVRTDGPGSDYLFQPFNKLLGSIGIELVMVHYPKLWTLSVGRQPDLLRIISTRCQRHG